MNLFESRKNRVLIAAHRGNWGGNILPNTILSYSAAIALGADLVEADILKSTDGVFYAYHSGEEKGNLGISERLDTLSSKEIDSLLFRNSMYNVTRQHVNRMDDVLDYLKGKCFINIDRGWLKDWEGTLDYLDRKDMKDQIIVKCPPEESLLEALDKKGKGIMYMAILRDEEMYERIRSFKNINLVAVETNYEESDSKIAQDSFISKMHSDGVLVWVNALTLDDDKRLSAGWDDNTSIEKGPEYGWGKLLEKGYDIIQTDWPSLLKEHIEKR